MPDNPDRSHPAGICRRDVLRSVFLGVLGLTAATGHGEAGENLQQAKPTEDYVPENNYPTFADEPHRRPSASSGEPSK